MFVVINYEWRLRLLICGKMRKALLSVDNEGVKNGRNQLSLTLKRQQVHCKKFNLHVFKCTIFCFVFRVIQDTRLATRIFELCKLQFSSFQVFKILL